MSRATLRTLLVFIVVSVVVFALPAFVTDFRAQQFSYVGIYLVALIGLNILTGYTGQISLGHGAFMAIGGYTTAILMTDHGVKDIATIPIAIVVTGVAGYLFGLPAARLSGLYLALATFAIAVAMPSVIKRFEGFTGGGSGVNLFGTPELTASLTPVRIAGFELNFNNWLYYLAWSIAMVGYVVGWLILRGRTGRAFRAVRDSETAAVSSGVSLARTKALAFGISAAYAGAAGALFAIATTYVNPDTFPVALSIFLLVGVVVAGLGSLTGTDRRRDLHPVHAALGAEHLEVAGRSGGRLRRVPDPRRAGSPGRRGGALCASRAADAARARLSEALTLGGYHRATTVERIGVSRATRTRPACTAKLMLMSFALVASLVLGATAAIAGTARGGGGPGRDADLDSPRRHGSAHRALGIAVRVGLARR